MIPHRVAWRPRAEPLEACAVFAAGQAALALRARMLADPEPGRLRGVATKDAMVLLGSDLPWADGVVYLGRDPEAPALLVPTRLEPDVPIAIVERALLRQTSGAPLAVVPPLVLPCASALALDRERLAAFGAP